MKASFTSIRFRLVLWFAVQTVLVLLVAGYVLQWRLRLVVEKEVGDKLASLAAAVASQLDPEMMALLQPGDENTRLYGRLRGDLEALCRAAGVRRIQVVDEARRLILDTQQGDIGEEVIRLRADLKEVQTALAGRRTSSVLFYDSEGKPVMSGYASLATASGRTMVVVVEGSAETLAAVGKLRESLLVLGLVALLFSTLLATVIASQITRPLRRLRDSARRIGEGVLQGPVPDLGRDEVGFLARTMEEMRRGILRHDEQQRAMLAGVAHEIRNPLGGIELYAGMLAEKYRGTKDGERIEKILREIAQLKRLVDEFLEFSRPSNPEPKVCSVKSVWDTVEELIYSHLDSVGVVRDGEDVDAWVDPVHLQSVLLNLARNACQAMTDGGLLRISVSKRDHSVLIRVSDTGPGIAVEERSKIFEPFFTTKATGAGLGLAIVKKLAEANRGVIRLVDEPEPGFSTTFEILLPQAEGEHP